MLNLTPPGILDKMEQNLFKLFETKQQNKRVLKNKKQIKFDCNVCFSIRHGEVFTKLYLCVYGWWFKSQYGIQRQKQNLDLTRWMEMSCVMKVRHLCFHCSHMWKTRIAFYSMANIGNSEYYCMQKRIFQILKIFSIFPVER